MKEYVVGVDLGGTKVEACFLDSDRNLLARKRVMSEASRGIEHVIKNIWTVVNEVSNWRGYAAVGIGTPGTYVEKDDCLYGAPHTPVYERPGFIQKLREKLKAPLIVENDANCLALAEFYASCVGKYHHVMAVILGTGVGSGLILDDKLYRGESGGAGEVGHASIDIHGRKCECGRTGCLEGYLSGPSISRRFQEISGRKMTAQEICDLYMTGDPDAVRLFEESCEIMGQAFGNIVNILDLDAIILGGGVSNIPIWYEKVPALISQSLFGVPRREIPLIKAKLGDSAGVFGAAYLALRETGHMDF